MDLALAGAAIWLSLGAIKGIIWLQQLPEFMGWWAFYRSGGDAEAPAWYTRPGHVAFAIGFGAFTMTVFTAIGALALPFERMRYFGPYGSAYVAGLAARMLKIPRGVEPLEFESWEEYQERVGDDPNKTAQAMHGVPFEKLPEKVKDVIKVAKGLHDLQDRNVPDVDEEDEFRKDDE